MTESNGSTPVQNTNPPPDRAQLLRLQQIRSTRLAIALLLPCMAYITYQVLTKQPVQEKPVSPALMDDSLNEGNSNSWGLITLDRNTESPVAVQPNVKTEGIKLDPNTASWSDLTVLPGIGEVTAKKIVAYRGEHATAGELVFRCATDLDAVSGIGPKTIEKLTPYLSIPADCDDDNDSVPRNENLR